MDTAPTADIVYQGICALFHNNNPKEKEKANKWLEEFQKSFYSWTISDELLQQKRDLHSCYFAAQTIRSKIQTSFNELPMNSHESLRDSLIAHIGQITNETDPIIVTQLSLSVADLSLLMATWQNPISDLLDLFSLKPESVWPLLEILTLIPEEIDSRYLRLGANRRQEIHRQLDAAVPRLIDILCICYQQSDNNERLTNATFRCFASWISIQAIPLESFTKNPLVQQAFRLLSSITTSRKVHDTCTECICALLNCIEADNLGIDIDPLLKAQIFQCVCALEPAYHISVAHEDIDKTLNYCRIFVVLCDAFFDEILSEDVDTPHYAKKGLDLILMCVGHYDYEVAEITFNLWYRISEDLFQRNNDKLTISFKPYIERLLGALFRHAQMDHDHDSLIEENENFYDFRRKVSDLIKDVAFIVGSGACFKQMFLTLQAPGSTWECTESALFIMQNVAKNIIPDENDIIPKVVEAILNLPANTHIAVRYTSIMLLGELCDWIENNPESLQAVLNFLLFSLQQKNGLASAAAIALTSICAACRQKMTCHINGLLEIARTLDSFEINNDLAIGLLKSISLTLSRMPKGQIETAMREIVSYQLQPLAEMITNGTNNVICKNERSDPAYWLDRTCAVLRHTSPDVGDNEIHPTLKILSDAWPLIAQVMQKYQSDVRIMERTCRLIRYGVRMIHKQASVLVEPLVKQIVILYANHRHSCFLYLGSVLVDEFARNDQCITGLLEMLKAFIQPTFNMLQADNGLKNNPDTVDDFFRLCSRFLECSPLPFLRSTLVTPIFQCALLACSLDHREANSSVMKFFCNLLKWGRNSNSRIPECRPLVKEIAEQNGKALVMNLIHAAVFCLNSYMLSDVAEVINDLKSVLTIQQIELYLTSALMTLPKENSGGFVTATQEQLNEFASAVLRADTTKSITISLKSFTRLFR